MSKQFWIILGVIAAVFVGIIIFNGNDKAPSSNAAPTSNIMGNTSSSVKFLEYGDFQCPACGSFYGPVKTAVDAYKDKIQFQFRNLPLTSLHPNAFSAARAGEAAALQGKFWEMHSMLYQNQTIWSAASDPLKYFSGYAQTLKLDTAKFKTDYASSKVNDVINADIAAFGKTGAEESTPTFFINGKKVDATKMLDASGQPSAEAIEKLLDDALAAGKSTT